jgi:hypothetical protein
MPKYLIEREIPGAGTLTPQELQGISSYVTGDKIYCVSVAPSEDMVRKHVIDPTTAEQH